MTIHTLTVKNSSTTHDTLKFSSTEHFINGEMIVGFIKGDPCTNLHVYDMNNCK